MPPLLFPRIPDFEDLRRCVRRIMEHMRIILPIIVGLVCAVVFFFVGVLYRKKVAEKEIGSAEEESKPVSYTHLDVYKRQASHPHGRFIQRGGNHCIHNTLHRHLTGNLGIFYCSHTAHG